MATQFSKVFKEGPRVAEIILKATQALDSKENSIGKDTLGQTTSSTWFSREYESGSAIVFNASLNAAFHVYGAIGAKWRALGGAKWGIPRSDEEPVGDGRGRRSRFDAGRDIYWTPTTGAFSVLGAIANRWHQLGSAQSYLGYPISDELDFTEGGKISSFEKGIIAWWPDTGALDLNQIRVRVIGLRCFGETDYDQLSSSDEPYVIVTVHSSGPDVQTHRSEVMEGVDAGEIRQTDKVVYQGPPAGIVLATHVFEHDEGNPDIYKKKIQDAALAVHRVGTFALTLIPVVGWAIAAIAGPIGEIAMPALGGAVSDALDLGDDHIGTFNVILTPKDLIVAACLRPYAEDSGLMSNASTPAIRGLGATYRVYFRVERII